MGLLVGGCFSSGLAGTGSALFFRICLVIVNASFVIAVVHRLIGYVMVFRVSGTGRREAFALVGWSLLVGLRSARG
ncbi:hypothetical protein AB0K34_29240 [Actinomadura sp. NPDC049382]|uniref:hypothetical protein n=1 Tax=Actinomadura sp. NPDC049382 TaxID=3158220 RepID=UPI00341FDE67